MKTSSLPSLLVILLCTFACQTPVSNNNSSESPAIKSQVFSLSDTETLNEQFGTVNLFTEGISTFGTEGTVTGILTLKPGSEAHPPHKHAEEEFLLVTKGSGTWSLNGEEFPANRGDLLYAAPWDLHGIINSDTVDLEFYFIKWNNKGVTSPMEE